MLGTVAALLRMIKFSHTVFALPFALIGALLGAGGLPEPAVVVWVLLAMVGARTAAMGFNRLVDCRFDAANPRTAARELPAGRIARRHAWGMVLAAAALFFVACHNLNPATLRFAPFALGLTLFYSFTKRFTAASHLVLGLALALSPLGGFLAVTGGLGGYPWWLSLGVLFWVAGFDTLYACMDVDFDRSVGLHSLPARRLAQLFHAAAFCGFFATGVDAALGAAYFAGLALAAVALVGQHRLIGPTDLSRIRLSFFTMNGAVSVTLLAATVAALLP
jgi:4-hydroxybenzoate polyprenyltransferase